MRIRIFFARLAVTELPVLVLLVAASVALERLLPAALVVAALFGLARWLAYGRPTVRTPGDWAIVLLVLMLPVTLWATALPDVTRPQVLRLLMGVALYYAVANWAGSMPRLHLVAIGLAATGLALALLAPLLGGAPAAARFIPAALSRLAGNVSDAVNPNIMAGALVVLAPLALAPLLFASGRVWTRLLGLISVLAMCVVIGLSGSRGAWLGLAAAALVLIALRWRWGWLALPLGALAGGLAVWRLGVPRIAEALTAAQALGGAEQRLEIWSRALYMLQDFPFTGIGMGGFRQVANLLYPFFLAGPDAEIPHAHNLFLQVGVDLGLPGLIAWLALLLSVCAAAWQVYRRGRTAGDVRLAGLGGALLACQVALVVHGLTDAATWGTRPAVIVWATWGLAMAEVTLTAKRDADDADSPD